MSTAVQQPSMADKGLKGGSLGLVAVIVIGVASTAPGYSLAARTGSTTYELVHRGPIPILVVPDPDED